MARWVVTRAHHLAAVGGLALTLAWAPAQAQQAPPGYRLVWHDEFDRDGLPDQTKWSYDVGGHGWGNKEPQFYTADRLENARVEGGHLVIEARRRAVAGGAVHVGPSRHQGQGRLDVWPYRGPRAAASRPRVLARHLDAPHHAGAHAMARRWRDRRHGARGLRPRHRARVGAHQGVSPQHRHAEDCESIRTRRRRRLPRLRPGVGYRQD